MTANSIARIWLSIQSQTLGDAGGGGIVRGGSPEPELGGLPAGMRSEAGFLMLEAAA
jgi:hypothetical protein